MAARYLVVLVSLVAAAACSAVPTDARSSGHAQSGTGGTESTPAVLDDDSTTAGPTGEDSTAESGSYLPEQQPIYQAVYGRLGISSTELHDRVQARRVSVFLACMSDRGYSVPNEVAAPIVRLPRPDFTPVDASIDEVRSTNSPVGTQIDERAASECYADVEPISPFNNLFSLLEVATKEVSDRVRVDDRYIAFANSREGCDAGQSDTDADRQQIQSQVQSIMTSYRSGELVAAAALDELEELRPVAGRIDWTTDGGCDAEAYAVERLLVAEYQQRYLDDNPGFVDGVVEQFEPVVQEFLDDK